MQYFMNEHIDIFQYDLEAFRYNMNSRTIKRKIVFQNEKKSIFVYLYVFKDQNPTKFK